MSFFGQAWGKTSFKNTRTNKPPSTHLSRPTHTITHFTPSKTDCKRASLALVAKDKAKVISAKSKEPKDQAEGSFADGSSVTQVEEVCSNFKQE